ncbi:MAG: hypothetical protein H7Y19_16190 [Luteimonas sp.]|nr:hypothetical protein [Luteimonas sp.]
MSNPAPNRFLRDRLPWIIAVVAVIAMAVTMFASRNDGQSKDPKDEVLERVIARLDALESGQTGPNGSRTATTAAAMSAGRPTSSRGDMAGLMGGERAQMTPEQMAADREKQMRELEAQFARDAADPVGGGRTEDTLEKTVTGETMAGTGLKPDDVDISCKKNSCRIVSSFAKLGDAQDWGLFYITAAGGNVLSQTQMVFVPQPDGSTEVRIYANRAKG